MDGCRSFAQEGDVQWICRMIGSQCSYMYWERRESSPVSEMTNVVFPPQALQ